MLHAKSFCAKHDLSGKKVALFLNACECNDLRVPWNVVNECMGAWKGILMLYGFERMLRLMHHLLSCFYLPLKIRNDYCC